MKNILLFFITFILAYASSESQNIPNEKLDFFSAEISKIQSTANEKSYTRGEGCYQVSFNDDNFIMYSYNQLAIKSEYKKGGGREVLALTENIDFSKATAVKNMAYGGLAGTIRVVFPKDYLKTQLFENGILLSTVNESFLEFFYDKANQEQIKKLRSLLNEMIALPKKATGQPYESFLNQAVYFNMYDKEKRETHLQTLINNGTSEAMRLKGDDYYNDKEYDKAVRCYEKAYQQNNYAEALYEIAVCKLFGRGYDRDYDEYTRLISRAAGLGSAKALHTLAPNYSRKYEYAMAINYTEKAIAAGYLYEFYRKQAYSSLFYYYGKLNQYSKIAALLTDEAVYASGFSETDLLNEKYSFLTGNGSCNEAVAYFTSMAEEANTKEVKAKLYECLAKMYDYGCDGSRGNKIKKNKKMETTFYLKSNAAAY